MISFGFALFIATRTAIIDAGNSCKEVAFNTKNIAEEYSAFSVLSSKFAALIPYGVAAPEMPSRLTERFIHAASSVFSSFVFRILDATGFKRRDTPRATPLSSHTFISPSHTA